MVNKAAIGGFSAILLVAAVIGVVAVTVTTRSGSHGASGDNLTSTSKSISALCGPAVYKDLCEQTLSSINETSTVGDIVRAAVHVIVGEVQYANQTAHELHKEAKGPIDNDGFEFCKELLVDAGEQLAAILSIADDGHRLDDFIAWLSMVLSYCTNCLASVESQDLNARLTTALQNTTELTDNAIGIISAIGSFAKELNLDLNITLEGATTTASRRLLSQENCPSWIPAADRKLLAAHSSISFHARPNAVVAKDGSGQFTTINAALKAMPKTYRGRYVIYVKAGLYKEKVIVTKDKPNLLIYGDGPRKTIVTGRLNYAEGVGTYLTSTFSVLAPGFIARSMGFTNTAGPQGHQAVALRLGADAAVLYNCRIDGFQDSFYPQSGRHFVRNCVISGTIDFIFGVSAVVIQNSLIIVRRPMDHQFNTVTAHGRDNSNEKNGIVIQNCRIVPDRNLFPDRFKIPSYLGRPWKRYSTTVVMESLLGDLIRPEGWHEWDGGYALNTLYYAEYNNRGPGANTRGRVNWRGYRVINRKEAMRWTAGPLLVGRAWIPYSGVPHALSLMK